MLIVVSQVAFQISDSFQANAGTCPFLRAQNLEDFDKVKFHPAQGGCGKDSRHKP